MIKTRLCGRNKPLFRTCKQSQPVQSHTKTTLGVNVKIRSDIAVAVAVAVANAVASLGVNGPLVCTSMINVGGWAHNLKFAKAPDVTKYFTRFSL